MATFNLFKISDLKIKQFKESYNPENNLKTTLKTLSINNQDVDFYIYTDIEDSKPTTLSWNWLIQEGDLQGKQIFKLPKAILYIEYENSIYALSFGVAYSDVDKFADKNFAFTFARKFNYKKIKSTAQANPNSNKNKTIVSYVDNEYFEYDTGGAYLKVKGQVELDENFNLFKNAIEVGSSIKFSVDNPSLEKFLEIVKYVSNKIKSAKDLSKIPLFQQIKDKNKLNELDENLKKNFDIDSCNISFADFDIIGTNAFFYSQSASYLVSCNGKRERLDYLTIDNIKSFCDKKGLDYKDNFFQIQVKLEGENQPHTLKEFIDYPVDNENCVLIKGEWYQYNNDFVESLKESLRHLDCEHNSIFDWDDAAYYDFINSKKTEYLMQDKYKQYNEESLIKEIKKTYYNEMIYNKNLAQKHNFECDDRGITRIANGQKIEINDLYKEGCLYSVKIGNSSGKLCYCVDQMTIAMHAIKNHAVHFDKEVKEVCIVLLLEKKSKYPNNNGSFDLDNLNYIALKNALNNWMKDARSLFYKPKVIIGYTNFKKGVNKNQ